MSDQFDKPPPPWKRSKPATTKKATKLSPETIRMAKARADAHGRKYPNLIDNMWAAQQQKKKKTSGR